MRTPPRPIARGPRGAAATGHPLATSAALRAFAEGGNAVDAAVASAYALFVVLPDNCGLGGDALLTIRAPSGVLTAFNGSGASPRDFDGVIADDGARTATVPGAVAALHDAHATFGRVAMKALLEPAVGLALDGFPAHDSLIEAIERQAGRLRRGAPEWEPLQGALAPGTRIRQRSLGHLIDVIAADGPEAFYAGPVAAAIESAARAENAALTAADLASHSTVVRPPIATSLRGATVWGQPPVTQAVLGLMALRALDALDDEDEINRTHVAIEAIEAAFARRDEIALPDAEDRLLAQDLDIDVAIAQRRGGPTVQTHTTAVTTADTDGFVVTMVVSVFDEFGCATLVPDYGFFLNNRVMGFSTDDSSPNYAAPGRRPVHTLSPMLVESDERTFAIATPGADGQVQTLTQLLDAIQVRGMSFTQALDQPRWRSANGSVIFEEGFDKATVAALAARGHRVDWELGGGIALFGAAGIAGFERETGSVFAAADLRCDAWAAAC